MSKALSRCGIWGLFAVAWIIVALSAALYALQHPWATWHPSVSTITLDLLQVLAFLLAVAGITVARTLGSLRRLSQIDVNAAENEDNFAAVVASAKDVSRDLREQSPTVGAELAEYFEALQRFVDTEGIGRRAPRRWGAVRWNATILLIVCCVNLMGITVYEAERPSNETGPTLIIVDWLLGIIFVVCWAVFFVFVTQAIWQMVHAVEIAVTEWKRRTDVVESQVADARTHLATTRTENGDPSQSWPGQNAYTRPKPSDESTTDDQLVTTNTSERA